MNIEQYRARDARIAIGLPIKQDNNEFEYPGYVDGALIAFYPNIHAANLALHSILDVGMAALIHGTGALPDVEYSPVGWAE